MPVQCCDYLKFLQSPVSSEEGDLGAGSVFKLES